MPVAVDQAEGRHRRARRSSVRFISSPSWPWMALLAALGRAFSVPGQGVHGRNLTGDLMGRLTFTEYFHLLLTGEEPTEEQRFFLDLLLVAMPRARDDAHERRGQDDPRRRPGLVSGGGRRRDPWVWAGHPGHGRSSPAAAGGRAGRRWCCEETRWSPRSSLVPSTSGGPPPISVLLQNRWSSSVPDSWKAPQPLGDHRRLLARIHPLPRGPQQPRARLGRAQDDRPTPKIRRRPPPEASPGRRRGFRPRRSWA